ncbi:hypothetical protein MJ560_09490 [Klebsiella pneumoniae]|nr:hypothetical protein MJ560_09490 [Klebsiella pneumoniae]
MMKAQHRANIRSVGALDGIHPRKIIVKTTKRYFCFPGVSTDQHVSIRGHRLSSLYTSSTFAVSCRFGSPRFTIHTGARDKCFFASETGGARVFDNCVCKHIVACYQACGEEYNKSPK